MMLVGFAGLGFAGYRSTRRRAASDFGAGQMASSRLLKKPRDKRLVFVVLA
jgi:hypothetical protein